MDEIAGAEVAEPRGGGARKALDEEVEGGGGPGRGGRGRDGEEDGVGRAGEAEGEELAGGGVGRKEAPVRREVEGDVVERGVGGGRADGGERRLGPLGEDLGRNRGRRGGGERRRGEEAEVVRPEEVEAARRGAYEHGGRSWGLVGDLQGVRTCGQDRTEEAARSERGMVPAGGGTDLAGPPARLESCRGGVRL